ncbi:3-phenylpropionate/cinnamic acid dioxygenase subunit beta [Nocardia sp. R7R-8]|uniref:3-phenylpropionate/cinnamic acid dioxygenase subunit beta n=1 Tax=Nocardia sp. R7R-8 TaxID=3459304 RepID=UPI00403E0B23
MSTAAQNNTTEFPKPLLDQETGLGSTASHDFTPRFRLTSADEQHEIEQFYYYEAALLDSHKFTTWVELFTDDCRYFVPIRQTRLTGQLDEEFSKPGEMAFFEDDKELLRLRAHKLESEYAWGENPPGRTRHFIANVRVVARDGDSLDTSCNFYFYRGTYERHSDWWVGRRDDHLVRDNGELRIANRTVLLDHTVILSQNMSHFF